MQELVQYMVEAIVDDPTAVSVTSTERVGQIVYEVDGAQDELGRVSGRSGRTAAALRAVGRAAAKKHDRYATVDILS